MFGFEEVAPFVGKIKDTIKFWKNKIEIPQHFQSCKKWANFAVGLRVLYKISKFIILRFCDSSQDKILECKIFLLKFCLKFLN
jgi:hypothetical protein